MTDLIDGAGTVSELQGNNHKINTIPKSFNNNLFYLHWWPFTCFCRFRFIFGFGSAFVQLCSAMKFGTTFLCIDSQFGNLANKRSALV